MLNKKFEKSYKLAVTATPRVILVMPTQPQLSDRVATRICRTRGIMKKFVCV